MRLHVKRSLARAAIAGLAGSALITVPSSPAHACELDCVNNVTVSLPTANYPGMSMTPSTDPADFAPDATGVTVLAAKNDVIAGNAGVLALQLSGAAAAPIPAEGAIDSTPGPGGGSPAPSGKVPISGYAQGNADWCVPASDATSLRAFGVTMTLQGMANAVGQGDSTSHEASSFTPSRKALNARESRNYYATSTPGDPTELLADVQTDIYYYRAPAIGAFHTSGLPWWSGSSSQGGHALTMYAYYTAGKGGFYVWDSAFSHVENLTAVQGYAAMRIMAPHLAPLLW